MDINRYSVWVSHVRSLLPSFDVIYTNNTLTSTLFGEAGIEVRKPRLYDSERYSGKEIRRRMMLGEDWRSLVPEAAARIIDEVGGEERIQMLRSEVPK